VNSRTCGCARAMEVMRSGSAFVAAATQFS
jgi:hypothetical protein